MKNTTYNKLKNNLTKIETLCKQIESGELSSDQTSAEAVLSINKIRADMVLESAKFKRNDPVIKKVNELMTQVHRVITKLDCKNCL